MVISFMIGTDWRGPMEYTAAMRILLVEDEVDVRRFFVRALAHIVPDVEIVEAADGSEGFATFQAGGFDLVLSDHKMPVMTGVDLLRAIRRESDVPFLLITADRGIERDALAAGVNELLSKPITLSALRAVVARYHAL
jgi:two-component system response regulator AtoC